MSQDTVLVPPHLLELLTAGHAPESVLELLDTHVRLERLRARCAGRPHLARRSLALVIPLFPHDDHPDTVFFDLSRDLSANTEAAPPAGESEEK
jgi:hypothetical protein